MALMKKFQFQGSSTLNRCKDAISIPPVPLNAPPLKSDLAKLKAQITYLHYALMELFHYQHHPVGDHDATPSVTGFSTTTL